MCISSKGGVVLFATLLLSGCTPFVVLAMKNSAVKHLAPNVRLELVPKSEPTTNGDFCGVIKVHPENEMDLYAPEIDLIITVTTPHQNEIFFNVEGNLIGNEDTTRRYPLLNVSHEELEKCNVSKYRGDMGRIAPKLSGKMRTSLDFTIPNQYFSAKGNYRIVCETFCMYGDLVLWKFKSNYIQVQKY